MEPLVEKMWRIFNFELIFIRSETIATNSLALEAGALRIRPTNPDPTQPFGRSWFIYTAEVGKEIKDQEPKRKLILGQTKPKQLILF